MKINKNRSLVQYNIKVPFNFINFLKNSKLKLKCLIADVFQKEEKNYTQYISRGVPNYIESSKDIYNCKSGFIKYFPEDLKKMENMTKEEIIKFKRQLRNEKKYYLE